MPSIEKAREVMDLMVQLQRKSSNYERYLNRLRVLYPQWAFSWDTIEGLCLYVPEGARIPRALQFGAARIVEILPDGSVVLTKDRTASRHEEAAAMAATLQTLKPHIEPRTIWEHLREDC